jgi:hypothetical protein
MPGVPFRVTLEQAYRMAGVLKAASRGISPEELVEGQGIANSMFDGLRAQRCFVFQELRKVFPYEVGVQDYAIGSIDDGADWDMDKPDKVNGAGTLIAGSSTPSEIPVEVVLDYVQWKAVICKQITSTIPRVLYYRPGNDTVVPVDLRVGVASLWPVPSQDGDIVLYVPGVLSEILDLEQPMFYPRGGYREFVEYQLACNVHDRYPTAIWSPMVEVRAREYKARIMAAQVTPQLITCDDGALNRSGVNSGRRWYDARTYTP